MQAVRECAKPAFTLIELLVVIAVIALLAALLFPVFARAREQSRVAVCFSNLKQIGIAIDLYLQDYDQTYPMSRFPDLAHPSTTCTAPPNQFPSANLEGTGYNWKRAAFSYIKNKAVLQCPSNSDAWRIVVAGQSAGGDESNGANPKDSFPNSYAVNGSFFHEAVPPCWYGEPSIRPRQQAEIDAPAALLWLVDSRMPYSDLGGWMLPPDDDDTQVFQQHNGKANWLFADHHAKRLGLQATCTPNMWSDRYPNRKSGCR